MMPVIKSSQIIDHARQPRALGIPGKSLKVESAAVAREVQLFEQNSQPGEKQKTAAVETLDGKSRRRAAEDSQRLGNDALSVPSLAKDAHTHAMSIDSGAAVSGAEGELTECIDKNPSVDVRREGYEEGREQGRDAGYEQGLQEGLRLGREEVAALQSCNERLAAVAEAISLSSQSWHAEVESAAIEIGYAALLRIVSHKSADRGMVESMVRAVLEQLPERRLLNIHLSPADHALLHDGQGMPPSLGAVLLADERVSMGGCIVDTDAGSLDGRLETRLAELKAVLVEVHQAREMP
jgi:flagellar assembly protein FliH